MPKSRYQFLTVSETAEALGRRRWFVYKELEAKRLAFYLIGGRRMISQGDLDDYVQRSRVAALGEKKKKILFTEQAKAEASAK
jgi:excisionase family DNA binding protein